MFAQNTIDYDPSNATAALDSLLEMKAIIPTAIIKQRASQRVDIRTKVTAMPGNSSQRHGLKIEGYTGDISQEGCQAVFPVTVVVGDIFWLEFEEGVVSSKFVMARCLRCRFLREDAFETGFRFFEPIKIRAHA